MENPCECVVAYFGWCGDNNPIEWLVEQFRSFCFEEEKKSQPDFDEDCYDKYQALDAVAEEYKWIKTAGLRGGGRVHSS